MEEINKKRRHQSGIVAILDTLGTKNYSDEEIEHFVNSRNLVSDFLQDTVIRKEIDEKKRLKEESIKRFTFNDTIIIALVSDSPEPEPTEIRAFLSLLRLFLTKHLEYKILFRGSFAIGDIYVIDEKTNTILGKAVTDAAEWYENAEWMGIIATPRTNIKIQHLIENDKLGANWKNLLLDYEVPLNDGKKTTMKVLNWPKVFKTSSLSPCQNGERPRVALLRLLGRLTIPRGVEDKFFNTIQFFDHAIKLNYKK